MVRAITIYAARYEALRRDEGGGAYALGHPLSMRSASSSAYDWSTYSSGSTESPGGVGDRSIERHCRREFKLQGARRLSFLCDEAPCGGLLYY
jgi:hypothetical protein